MNTELANCRLRGGASLLAAIALAFALLLGFAMPAYADEPGTLQTAPSLSAGTDDGATFAWSGGSGRLKGIDCIAVANAGEDVVATIQFQSDTYESARVGGVEYPSTTPGTDVSTFEIPVKPGVPMRIEALSTAMSQPHWIAYNICYVDTAASDAPAADAASILKQYDKFTTACDTVEGVFNDAVVQTVNASMRSAAPQAYEPHATVSLEGVSTLEDPKAPSIDGLTYETSLALQYADQFAVHYYEGGFKVIEIVNGGSFLVVPDGAEAPANLPDDMKVLYQPLDRIYLCATSAMALFDSIDGIGAVTLTGTDVSGWEIDAPKHALQSGTMRYAGKYSAPDYEMLLAHNCDLALESTMILHNPEVQEMIEQLDIPVLIERSSYETEPLGRTEWVKLYGALLNREIEAEEYFAHQVQTVDSLNVTGSTGKTVVFFAVNTDGSVVIRRPSDYVARCIELGGGTYAFENLSAPGSSNTLDVSMEQFYSVAASADYLVYNGTIQNPINTIDDLIALSETFADFKAVKEGNVWSCGRDMFQSTHKMAQLIQDFNILVNDGDPAGMTFLYKVG